MFTTNNWCRGRIARKVLVAPLHAQCFAFIEGWRSADPLSRAFLLSHSFLSDRIHFLFGRDFVEALGFSCGQWNSFALGCREGGGS